MLLRLLILFIGPLIEIRNSRRLAQLPQPAIYAFNHNNAFEALAVPAILIYLRNGRPIHFFVDWMYLRIPILGRILRQCQPIPVFTKKARWDLWRTYRRRQLRRNPVTEALERLDAGGCVGIFPEGTRNGHVEKLRRGRLGIGDLVLGTGAPVVPVGIQFKARHRLGRMPVLGRIRLVVGRPLVFAEERESGRQRPGKASGAQPCIGRASVRLRRNIVQQVMESLAEVSSKTYPYDFSADRKAPSVAPDTALSTDRLEAL